MDSAYARLRALERTLNSATVWDLTVQELAEFMAVRRELCNQLAKKPIAPKVEVVYQ